MRISFLAVISAALTLSGCTTLPKPFVEESPVSATEIFQAVACEFVAAANAYPVLKDWGATADMTISRLDNTLVAPGFSWSGTVKGVAIDDAGASLKNETNVDSEVEVTHDYTLIGTRAFKECPDGKLQPAGLGIAPELMHQMSIVGDLSPSNVTKMKLDRTFKVTRTAGGGLSFTIYDVNVKVEGSSASRLDKNFITIALQPLVHQTLDALRGSIRQQLTDDDTQRKLTDALREATKPVTE